MQAKVTMIPATRNALTGVPKNSKAKRRVAAYARVSTDTDTLPIEFDPYLWRLVVEKAVVRSDGIVEFHLIDNKIYAQSNSLRK